MERVCLIGQDGCRGPLRDPETTCRYLESPELAVDVVAYNSKVYYMITQGRRPGRQRPPPAGHRQRDGLGRHQPGQRPVQVSSKNIWIVRPSAADRGRDDPARRLGRHHQPRGHGHQLPDLPRRSGLRRREPAGYAEQPDCREDGPHRADHGHCQLDHFHRQRSEQHSGAGGEVLKELVRKGLITDDGK